MKTEVKKIAEQLVLNSATTLLGSARKIKSDLLLADIKMLKSAYDLNNKFLKSDAQKGLRKTGRLVILSKYLAQHGKEISVPDFLKLLQETKLDLSKVQKDYLNQLEEEAINIFLQQQDPSKIDVLLQVMVQKDFTISQTTFDHFKAKMLDLDFPTRLQIFNRTAQNLSEKRVQRSGSNMTDAVGKTSSNFSDLFYSQLSSYDLDQITALITSPNLGAVRYFHSYLNQFKRSENLDFEEILTSLERRNIALSNFSVQQMEAIISSPNFDESQRNRIFLPFIQSGKISTEIMARLLHNLYAEKSVTYAYYISNENESIFKAFFDQNDFTINDVKTLLDVVSKAAAQNPKKVRQYNDKTAILRCAANSPHLKSSVAEFLKLVIQTNCPADEKSRIIFDYCQRNNTPITEEDLESVKLTLRDAHQLGLAKFNIEATIAKKFLQQSGETIEVKTFEALLRFAPELDITFSSIAPQKLLEAIPDDLRVPLFSSLYPAVAGKTAADCLSEDAISLFPPIRAETPMSKVLSFCYYTKKFETLSRHLHDETKAEFARVYTPSPDRLLMSPLDYELLLTTVATNDLAHYFISSQEVCEYFDNLVTPKIKKFSDADRKKFKISNAKNVEKTFPGITAKLKALIANDDPSEDDVKSFFEMILGADVGYDKDVNLGRSINKYMRDFWIRDRDKILTLLETKNGLESFIACCNTMTNGCSANIGSQLTIALYTTLLELDKRKKTESLNPEAIIFDFMVSKVITPVLANDKNDSIGLQPNPLKLSTIHQLKISPSAFLAELAKSLSANSSTAMSFVGEKLGDEGEAFIETLSDICKKFSGKESQQKETNAYLHAAAYLVAKSSNAPLILPANIDLGFSNDDNKKLQEIIEKCVAPSTEPAHDLRSQSLTKDNREIRR